MIETKRTENTAYAVTAAVLFAALPFLGLKGLVLIPGMFMSFVIVMDPIIGLVCLILSGTCFQIIGSSHLTGLPLSFGKIFGLLTLGSWALYLIRERVRFSYSPQMIALLLFAAVVVFSTAVMPDRRWSLTGLFKFVQVYLFYFLIANLAGENRKQLLITVGAVTAGLVICGVIGTGEFLSPNMTIESDDPRVAEGTLGAVLDRESLDTGKVIKRITGGLADANWLAYTLAAVLPINLFWWRHVKGNWSKLLVLFCAGMQMTGLILSYTRTGLFGFGVAVIYMLVRRLLPFWRTAILGMVLLIIAVILMPSTFTERMFSKKYLKKGSTPMREDLMTAAWNMFIDKPLLGFGYGQFGFEFMKRVSTNPSMRLGAWGMELEKAVDSGREQEHNIGTHNLYLEVLVEYGIFGFIPFMAFLWLIMRDLRLCEMHGSPLERDLAVCLMAGILSFLACGLLGHAKTLKILWILAGLSAALRRITFERYELSEDEESKDAASENRTQIGKPEKGLQ